MRAARAGAGRRPVRVDVPGGPRLRPGGTTTGCSPDVGSDASGVSGRLRLKVFDDRARATVFRNRSATSPSPAMSPSSVGAACGRWSGDEPTGHHQRQRHQESDRQPWKHVGDRQRDLQDQALRLAVERSALTVYRVMMPTPNATSGGWAAAVNRARRRTSSAAATQPTRKQNLKRRAEFVGAAGVDTRADRGDRDGDQNRTPPGHTPRRVGNTDCWPAGTADAVRCAENTPRRYRLYAWMRRSAAPCVSPVRLCSRSMSRCSEFSVAGHDYRESWDACGVVAGLTGPDGRSGYGVDTLPGWWVLPGHRALRGPRVCGR